MPDPRLSAAADDLERLALSTAEELHQVQDRVAFARRCLDVLVQHGPALLDLTLRIVEKLGAVAV